MWPAASCCHAERHTEREHKSSLARCDGRAQLSCTATSGRLLSMGNRTGTRCAAHEPKNSIAAPKLCDRTLLWSERAARQLNGSGSGLDNNGAAGGTSSSDRASACGGARSCTVALTRTLGRLHQSEKLQALTARGRTGAQRRPELPSAASLTIKPK